MRLTRQMASWKSLSIISLFIVAQLSGCSTTATEDDDTTNTFVNIVSMSGESANSTGSDEGEDVLSDVCITSDNDLNCSVVNDNGIVVMSAQAKDLTNVSSSVQDIVFTRYRVTFIRADGRNVPGVDVPFPFDGAANFRVPATSTAVTRVFLLVRHQAKLESPLAELTGGGGSQVISTIARIDFFGQDLAGRQLQVSGFLNVTFADFG